MKAEDTMGGWNVNIQKAFIFLVGEASKQPTNHIKISQSANFPTGNIIEAEAICGLVIPASS